MSTNYRYAVTNTQTGDILEVLDCPKKAIAVALAHTGIEVKVTHCWNPQDKCWLLHLRKQNQEPEPIACSFDPNWETAQENMLSQAILNLNYGGYIHPLHVDYDIEIRDIARSTSSQRIYVWFSQGIADFTAVIEPDQKMLSIKWTADLNNPDKHWLDLCPPTHLWVIQLILGAASIRDVQDLKQDGMHLSWKWS